MLLTSNVAEGTTVVTADQTAGRGQRGNTWEAEPGKNLTFSVLLKPVFLAATEQFNLNIAISLAVYSFLSNYFTENIKIKWPNDIYFKDSKLGGILIENTVKGAYIAQSVIGIGLNVNQTDFKSPQAISMASANCSISQVTPVYVLDDLLNEILEQVERFYLELRAGQANFHRHTYLQCLFGYQEQRLFRVKDAIAPGKICGIDAIGKLQVEFETGIESFGFKEIEFII